MTAALMPDYQRNLRYFSIAILSILCILNFIAFYSSIDDGTENPFRPDGELSKEADEIVNLIKGE